MGRGNCHGTGRIHSVTEGEMIGRIFKLGAYAKAPKATFSILHPRTALKLGAAMWVAKKVFGGGKRERTRNSRTAG